jgi:hypothetical protein
MTSKPWHLLNKNKHPRTPSEIASDRLSMCEGCPSLISGICKECGCIMKLKVTLDSATCPMGKW